MPSAEGLYSMDIVLMLLPLLLAKRQDKQNINKSLSFIHCNQLTICQKKKKREKTHFTEGCTYACLTTTERDENKGKGSDGGN